MKPNSNFKLSREAKCVLAMINDKAKRSAIRKLFIESELIKEQQSRMRGRQKDSE